MLSSHETPWMEHNSNLKHFSGTYTIPQLRNVNICKRQLYIGENVVKEFDVPGVGVDGGKYYRLYEYKQSGEDEDDEDGLYDGFLTQYYQKFTGDISKVPECKLNQSYYQWVPYILAFQGLMFLIPNTGFQINN